MANEETLFSVKCELEDKDFEEVYRIYLAAEKKSRYTPLIVCGLLAAAFVLLAIVLKNITMVLYAVACGLIALSYWFIPANKKFLANNRLQYGDIREMTFFPHEITTFEWLDDDEEISEEEREEATTHFSTNTLKAYENRQGILFADGSIANNFLYVPKRCMDDETLAMMIDFAKDSCAGGYELLEMQSVLGDSKDLTAEVEDADAGDFCEQYYGAENLRICDENGKRVHDYEDDADVSEETAEDPEDDSELLDFSEVEESETDEDAADFTEVETDAEEENADEA